MIDLLARQIEQLTATELGRREWRSSKKCCLVLGAGYSRSLGAPLINDSLSGRHRLSLSGIYGKNHAEVFSPQAATVYRLYHHCNPGTDELDAETGPFSRLWDLARDGLKVANSVGHLLRFRKTDARANGRRPSR